mgnify:CR=1 FL=1
MVNGNASLSIILKAGFGKPPEFPFQPFVKGFPVHGRQVGFLPVLDLLSQQKGGGKFGLQIRTYLRGAAEYIPAGFGKPLGDGGLGQRE